MKRFLVVTAAAALCLCTTGCLQQAQQLPLEDVIPAVTLPEPYAPESEKTNATEPNQPDLILDRGGWTVTLPGEYAHLILTESEAEAANGRQTLLAVYEKASVEAAARGMGDSRGMGFLFGITMLEGQAFRDWLVEDFPGYTLFARDDAGRYFFRVEPTDVRFYRSDYTAADAAEWETLSALAIPICEQFITDNCLTPYTRAEALKNTMPSIRIPAALDNADPFSIPYSLPAEVTARSDWNYDAQIQKVAEYPDAELELYDLREPWEATLYLRWDGCEGVFQGTHISPHGFSLQHSLTDVDSDGQQELVVIGTPGTGPGVSVDSLHIFRKTDGGITRYTLADLRYLRESVEPVYQAIVSAIDPATRTIGGSLNIPNGLDINPNIGSHISFSMENGAITGTWGIHFIRTGTTFAGSSDYTVLLTADIIPDRGSFLLTNLRLSPA